MRASAAVKLFLLRLARTLSEAVMEAGSRPGQAELVSCAALAEMLPADRRVRDPAAASTIAASFARTSISLIVMLALG